MDTGLLIIRLVVGLTMAAHGGQKLFGGLERTGKMFGSMGYRPGLIFAAIAGLSEFGGGIGLAAGFLTPLAGAAIAGTMLNAILSVHLKNGFWTTKGGFEYNLVLAVSSLGLGFTGPGAASLDRAFGWHLDGTGWGLTAVGLTIVIGLATALYRQRNLAADQRKGAAQPSSETAEESSVS